MFVAFRGGDVDVGHLGTVQSPFGLAHLLPLTVVAVGRVHKRLRVRRGTDRWPAAT